MATFSRGQAAVVADDVNPTATFGSTPTSGSLLVAFCFSRSGTSTTSHAISGTGWTKFIARDVELGNASFRRSLSGWWKVAGASEPTGIQITGGDTVRLMIQEFATDTAITWELVDTASNDNGATNDATSIATGTTASVAATDNLLVGILGYRTNAAEFSITWASENLTDTALSAGDSPSRGVGSAWLQQTTGGTKASTVGDIAANTGLTAAIGVFAAVSAASPQLLTPIADISSGAWTPSSGLDLYAMIDETTADAADYIVSTSASTCEVRLAVGSDPAVSTGHILRYQLLAGSGAATVRLKQGAATIATFGPHTLTGSTQDFEQTLSGAQADSITDYSDLRVSFEAA